MNIITQLQRDAAAFVAADEKLHHVQVLQEGARGEPGALLFENAVSQAITGNVSVNGKAGLCVIFFAPEGKPASRANKGLVTDFEMVVRVIENPAVNDDPVYGTGIACEDMMLEVMLMLQIWTPVRGHPLQVSGFYLQEIKDAPHLRAWECVITSQDAQAGRPRCAPPVADVGGLTIRLTCTTAEAQIYYTLDGSLPTPKCGTLYDGPFQVTTPVTMRAMAWAAGRMGSHCIEEDL